MRPNLEHADLWARRDTDPRARETLINAYLHLVEITRKKVCPHIPYRVTGEDLDGAGMVGLVLAVDRFSLRRGVQFRSYAIDCITGAIRECLRREDAAPRLVRRRQKELEAYEATGRLPVGLSLEQVKAGARELEFFSLDAPIGPDDAGSRTDIVDDTLRRISSVPDPRPLPAEIVLAEEGIRLASERLWRAVAIYLPRPQAFMITRYYTSDLSMKAISREMGKSESRAHQLHKEGIARLREHLTRAEVTP
jgi:RNA polymerase sigma factor for flagellar operon FliA